MQIKIKKLVPEAVIPNKAHSTDVGLDVVAVSENIVNTPEYGYIEYGLGIAISTPIGFAAFIYPRSSISKTGLILCNSVPVIDPGYTGEIKLRFKWIPGTAKYKIGDKIGQLVIQKFEQVEFEEVEELVETERGTGGFGSSGS